MPEITKQRRRRCKHCHARIPIQPRKKRELSRYNKFIQVEFQKEEIKNVEDAKERMKLVARRWREEKEKETPS